MKAKGAPGNVPLERACGAPLPRKFRRGGGGCAPRHPECEWPQEAGTIGCTTKYPKFACGKFRPFRSIRFSGRRDEPMAWGLLV